MTQPLLVLTAGDPAGIGPEVLVKALRDPHVQAACRTVIIGEPDSLRAAGWSEQLAPLIPMQSLSPRPRRPGPSAWGGEISYKALQLACRFAAQGRADAVVTAPISKQSWALAGVPFTGHTEFLRTYYGAEALMMFASGPLRCALVSEHFAVRDLPRILTRARILRTGKSFAAALRRTGVARPRLALSGLNPHNGDNGKFGNEENTVILPAMQALRRLHIQAQGPYPADALWLKHRQGQFDGILCMYHDQALLGLKLAAREPVVHITAGLDFLRTSPAHGTAFDIAGQNRADAASMTAAILTAARHSI